MVLVYGGVRNTGLFFGVVSRFSDFTMKNITHYTFKLQSLALPSCIGFLSSSDILISDLFDCRVMIISTSAIQESA